MSGVLNYVCMGSNYLDGLQGDHAEVSPNSMRHFTRMHNCSRDNVLRTVQYSGPEEKGEETAQRTRT